MTTVLIRYKGGGEVTTNIEEEILASNDIIPLRYGKYATRAGTLASGMALYDECDPPKPVVVAPPSSLPADAPVASPPDVIIPPAPETPVVPQVPVESSTSSAPAADAAGTSTIPVGQ